QQQVGLAARRRQAGEKAQDVRRAGDVLSQAFVDRRDTLRLVGGEGAVARRETIVGVRCAGHDYFRPISRLPSLSCLTVSPGSTTVLQSSCSRIAGPSNTASSGSRSRA